MVALDLLHTARDRLTRALEISRPSVDSQRDDVANEIIELASTADAELATACEQLRVPALPAELLPPPARSTDTNGGLAVVVSLIGLLREWRTRRWLRRRLVLVDALIAANQTQDATDEGPYR